MDFDDINIAGVIFAVLAAGIGIIVANSMGDSGLLMKLIAGVCCAVAGYFVGGKIADG